MGSFAQRLRDAMQSAGLKAVDLHERTGISKASISEYLSGNYEPKQKNVYRLAKALHVAPSYLMGLSEPDPASAPPVPQKSDGLTIKKSRAPSQDSCFCRISRGRSCSSFAHRQCAWREQVHHFG